MRGEGLVEFKLVSLVDLLANADPAAFLADYQVVVLTESNLDAAGEQLVRDYVTAGGSLIAMRPDHGLADVVGVNFGSARPESQPPVPGRRHEPQPGCGHLRTVDAVPRCGRELQLGRCRLPRHALQRHQYAIVEPRRDLEHVRRGKAATFSFDLAKSIVLSRQGNPDWKDSEGCDGLAATDQWTCSSVATVSSTSRPAGRGSPGRRASALLREPHPGALHRSAAPLVVPAGQRTRRSSSTRATARMTPGRTGHGRPGRRQLRRHVLDLLPRARHQRHVGGDGSRLAGGRP